MNDFANLEKTIVRELSCRLCLCTDVVKLKPLSAEIKRKIKKLFDITIRSDDALPKAICHDCLLHISNLYLYAVKVEKTQKFLEFHRLKTFEEKRETQVQPDIKMRPIINNPIINVGTLSAHNITDSKKTNIGKSTPPSETHQGDTKQPKHKLPPKKKSPSDLKFMEAMTLEEFAKTERVDKSLLSTSSSSKSPAHINEKTNPRKKEPQKTHEPLDDTLDPIVIIDGRPAKQGPALDRQITLFYKMECCICHEKGFHFRSLMRHYKDRHGVPGYVTCCEKKFHYFYPKKIIEHMAFHLQPNIFMCPSCHQNFPTSQELSDHQTNGGRSEGKIICPRCSERFPTFHELGWHIIMHRSDKMQCDYCGKLLKHHHRKKTINHMEDVILCSLCIRALRNIEKQEKDIKEKVKAKGNDAITLQKYQKFRQAMGLSGDEDGSTD